MSITKAQINKVLKSFGLDRVRKDKDYSGMNSVCIRDWENKLISGVFLTSHSPMDVTSAAMDRANNTIRAIDNALREELGIVADEHGRYKLSENKKSITYLSLDTHRYPAYTRCMNLDDGYQNSYLLPNIYKTDK